MTNKWYKFIWKPSALVTEHATKYGTLYYVLEEEGEHIWVRNPSKYYPTTQPIKKDMIASVCEIECDEPYFRKLPLKDRIAIKRGAYYA